MNTTGDQGHSRLSSMISESGLLPGKCSVCGDETRNEQITACEPCRAFFLRTMLKHQEYKCNFGGRCEINITTRKRCKKCRYHKCFQVGMASEWLSGEHDKVKRRQFIEDNRRSAKNSVHQSGSSRAGSEGSQSGSSSNDSSTLATTAVTSWPSIHQNTTVGSSYDPFGYNHAKPQQRKSNYEDFSTMNVTDQACTSSNADGGREEMVNVSKSYFLQLINICQSRANASSSHNQSDSCDELLTLAKKIYENDGSSNQYNGNDKYTQMNQKNGLIEIASKNSKRITNLDGFPGGLSMLKVHRINELIECRNKALDGLASELIYCGYEAPGMGVPYNVDRYMDGVNTVACYCRRTIDMGRTLSALRSLTPTDQLILLQNTIRERMVIISVTNYSHELDAWVPLGKQQPFMMKLDIMKKMDSAQFIPHYRFLRSFRPEWNSDMVIMQTLMAMLLFDATRPGLLDPLAVQQHHTFYSDLLKDHLVSIYGQVDGQRVFACLMSRLVWMRKHIDNLQSYLVLQLSSEDMSVLVMDVIFSSQSNH